MLHLMPVQIAVLVFTLIVGLVLGYVGNRSGQKWRKRFEAERDFYADFRGKTEALIAEKNERIAALDARISDLTRPAPPPAEPEAPAVTPEIIPVPAPVAVIDPAPEAPMAEAVPAVVADPAPLALIDTPAAETLDSEAEAVEAHPLPIADANVAPALAAAEPVLLEAPAPEALPVAVVGEEATTLPPVSDDNPTPETAASDENPPSQIGTAPMLAASGLSRIRGIDAAMEARLNDAGIHTAEDIEKLSAEDEMALEQRLDLPPGHIALEQWRLQAALIDSGDEPVFTLPDHEPLEMTEPAPAIKDSTAPDHPTPANADDSPKASQPVA